MGLFSRITDARDRKADRETRQYRRDQAEYEQGRVDRRWKQAQDRRLYLRAGKGRGA